MIPSPPPQKVDIIVIHDARAVYDTASLRFTDFGVNGHMGWTEAEVKPAPESGSASVPGAHINADTGAFISPKGAVPVVSKLGAWHPVAIAAAAKQPTATTYSWNEPLRDRRGPPTAEELYSPFVNGGTIVFRYDPSASGIEQFNSARLIFPDWAHEVAPASVFVESHRGLIENGEQRSPEIAQLTQLLAEKNRFLVVEAFRELADSGHLPGKVALEHLLRSEGPLEAVLTQLMLSNRGQDFTEQVTAAVSSCRNEEKLQSMALGAFSALLFHSEDARVLARSKAALQQIRSRLQELKIPSGENPYLYAILNKAGVE